MNNWPNDWRIPSDKSVALLLSGGVDSSAALYRLVEAGCHPDLFYIRIGMDEDNDLTCTAEEDIEMATLMAKRTGCQLHVVDLHQDYWDKVVTYTIETVKQGLTPNPDMMCNKLIKFGCFSEKYGQAYDYIATGHYATRIDKDGLPCLATAPDPVKDQTDFLAQINFAQMSRLIFPIGDLTKAEVRDYAAKAGLPTAKRKDSQGICFLGKINYNTFIEKYLGKKPGRIIDRETGKTIGTHNGYWFHTIGQRKGLGLSGGPWFVVKKDIKRNIILVSRGYDPIEQYGKTICIHQMDFISYNPIKAALGVGQDEAYPEVIQPISISGSLKIRHTPSFSNAILMRQSNGSFIIESETPIQGIAPGQYAVFYDEDQRICYGSGMITKGF